MSEEGNLSNRLITSAKDLTRSSTGFSALLIFITLLLLGVVFGLRFQPQPTYNFQVASPDDEKDSSLSQNSNEINSNLRDQTELSEEDLLIIRTKLEEQAYASDLNQQKIDIQGIINDMEANDNGPNPNDEVISLNTFNDYVGQTSENDEVHELHASRLNELIESQKNTNDQTIPDEEVYEIISEQIEKREEMIIQEEELVDDLLSVTESGILPESITNGHTQALVQEKSLEKSIEEYEKSLESDENLSEEAKIQIRNALSETRSNFNEEREKRRDRLLQVKQQSSDQELDITEQERLKALIEEEDTEYANDLREHQMDLDRMVSEEVTDQNIIKDSSNDDYQLQKFQSEMLAEDIDGLLNELEEEKGILVKPDGFVDELLSRQSDRSSVEGEIDELNLELIEELPDDMSQDEKQALIDKSKREKSQRSNLNNKKELLLGRLSSPKNIRADQSSSSDLMNLERGLDLANQKIDLILYLLTTNNSLERSADNKINQTQENIQIPEFETKKEDTREESKDLDLIPPIIKEEDKISEEPLFTYDQINSNNQESLNEQIKSEQNEFENFDGSDGLSESLKKKSRWFISRATYRPELKYPVEAEKKGIEGDCLVSFNINSNGKTQDASANCTDDIFVNTTEQTLAEWEFEPDNYINPMVEVVYNIKSF